jgi:hypothetical protein
MRSSYYALVAIFGLNPKERARDSGHREGFTKESGKLV